MSWPSPSGSPPGRPSSHTTRSPNATEPARLSPRYPTIEIRVPDVVPDVADSVLLAALARGLVDVTVRQWHRRVRPLDLSQQTLRAAAWRASRRGITEDLYDPLSDRARAGWAGGRTPT